MLRYRLYRECGPVLRARPRRSLGHLAAVLREMNNQRNDVGVAKRKAGVRRVNRSY